jgi:hypothetical protein
MLLTDIFNLLSSFRQVFNRNIQFLWFCLIVLFFAICHEPMFITSIIRSLGLKASVYDALRKQFKKKSSAFLVKLRKAHLDFTYHFFKNDFFRSNGKIILVLDGNKVTKEGRKMPGAKLQHSSSQDSTKAKFFHGMHFQNACFLIQERIDNNNIIKAVSLQSQLTDGIKRTKKENKKYLDVSLEMVKEISKHLSHYNEQPPLVVVDSYYSSGKFIQQLFQETGCYVVTRVRKNAVAYTLYQAPTNPRKRGRPKKYGEKLKLNEYFTDRKIPKYEYTLVQNGESFEGEYWEQVLVCKNAQQQMKYVGFSCAKGNIIFVSSDTEMDAREMIEVYVGRFQIEFEIKALKQDLQAYRFHFWTKSMKKTKREDKYLDLSKLDSKSKKNVISTLNAMEVFIQYAIVAQTCLKWIGQKRQKEIAKKRKYYRTINDSRSYSEKVVKDVVADEYVNFLRELILKENWKKFLETRLSKGMLNLVRNRQKWAA